MEVKWITANQQVIDACGRVAVMRGPLVYCFESKDNGGDVLSLSLRTDMGLREERSDELFGGTVTVKACALRQKDFGGLYSDEKPETEECEAAAVPYYAWGNRGEGQMRVWMERG